MTLDETIKGIQPPDRAAMDRAQQHWLDVAKPLFSLGKLEKIITQIAGIKGSEVFSLDKKALIIMCADNGVVAEGVTQTGQDVTATVTGNFLTGQASSCIMAKRAGADVFAVDVGVAVDVEGVTDKAVKITYGTQNMTKGAAMTRQQAIAAIELGINKVCQLKNMGYDIIATGEMGIGNTTTSSAITSVFLSAEPEKVTGRGAGLSSEGLNRKIDAVKRAIAINKPNKNDPVDVLHKVGGLDIAALTGVFIGGAYCNIPVVADGFISSAAALAAVRLCPHVRDYIIPSHLSKEPACLMIAEELGFDPVIHADMCLGEGTGALTLFPIIDMALDVYTKLHTFQTWNGNDTYKILK